MSKGFVSMDLVLVMIVFITVLTAVVFVGSLTTTKITDAINDSGLDMNTTALNQTQDAYQMFNTGLPLIFFAFMIIGILLAVSLNTSPVISIFIFLTIATIGYVAQAMSNAFHELASSAAVTSTANEFSYIMYIMDNLGLLVLIGGVLIVLFMFTKPKSFNI